MLCEPVCYVLSPYLAREFTYRSMYSSFPIIHGSTVNDPSLFHCLVLFCSELLSTRVASSAFPT